MATQPLGSDITNTAESEPGPSGNGVLSAPDLQLDCLDDDDAEEEEEADEVEDSDGDNQTVNVVPDTDGQTDSVVDSRGPPEASLDSPSSDTATTASTDSSEDAPPPRIPWHFGFTAQRLRSASTSDSVPPPKYRRLNSGRDPFGHHNPHHISSSLYVPHALLLRRQQLQRELQRRFRTVRDVDDGAELELPLTISSLRHRILLDHMAVGVGGDTRFNRLLQLVGMRGLPVGVRQELIDHHTTTSKYRGEDVAEKEEDREKCTICLVNFEADIDIRTLGCRHCFHTECVDRWLKSNWIKGCPICRLNIDANAKSKTGPDNPPVPPPPPPDSRDTGSTSS